jgi:hypothetical protein
MRKLAFALLLAVVMPTALHAQDASLQQAQALFDRYVALATAFDQQVADLYADSAHIKTTRVYPDGQSRSMTMPALTYKSLIRQVMPQAKAAGDVSTYSDVKLAPEQDRVRINATRYSKLKNYSSPFSMLVGPDASGTCRIFEEVSESRP